MKVLFAVLYVIFILSRGSTHETFV